MIEHFIILIIALLLFLFSIDKNHFISAIFVLSILFWVSSFILMTFRAETIGNDTIAYVNYFNECLNFDDYMSLYQSSRFEPGYIFLNYIVSRFSDNYTVLFIICDLIYLGNTIYFFRKYCFDKNRWIVLWLIFGLYYWMFTGMRAGLALAFIYLFIDRLLEGKQIQSIIWFLVACSFHYSALVCAIILFAKSKYFSKFTNNKLILVIAFIIIATALDKIMELIPATYSAYYFDSQYGEGPVRLASIMDFTFVFFLYNLTRNTNILFWHNQSKFRVLFLFELGFSFLGMIFNPFNRIELFFIPFSIVYVSNTICYLTSIKRLWTIVILAGMMFYQVIAFIYRPEWLGIFPYSWK